jgi:hypothetical protein
MRVESSVLCAVRRDCGDECLSFFLTDFSGFSTHTHTLGSPISPAKLFKLHLINQSIHRAPHRIRT